MVERIIDPPSLPYDMAKSLGQIHTVNIRDTVSTAPGPRTNIDLAGELTSQLQHMVRAGNSFKVVGIDMSLAADGTLGGGQVTGYFRYYAPTRGRCQAFRNAFTAMREAMKLQGINMTANHQYDFRAPLNDHVDSNNVFRNQASLDGTNGLTLGPAGSGALDYSIFGVYNKSVLPVTNASTPAGDLFASGFNTMGVQTTPTDFVLNDTAIYSGNADEASIEYEEIPFMLSWTPDTTDIATMFEWRPDPALYTSILSGQLQMFIEEINLDGGAPGIDVDIAVHVAGWKSIMGSPDRKKKRTAKKSSSKKSSSKKKE